jgi:putative ABC transport system permease protein
MRLTDFIRFAFGTITFQRQRSFLTTLGIAIGIAAVVLLTSIGEGIHHFVLDEFTQFGTNLIGVNPGKAKTAGTSIGIFGTDRPLTIADAEALQRTPHAIAVIPFVQGNAEVEGNDRRRRTTVYGTGPDMPLAFNIKVGAGHFLPDDDPTTPRAFAVLGSKLRNELFGDKNPLGELIRIGGDRYRVIGSMESKGQVLGIDLDDSVHIPVARALEMFNRDSLMEIDVVYQEGAPVDEVVAGMRRILTARHGRDDVTITTQEQMLDVLGSVLNILTFAVGALGGISLLVGGVGILTIMIIAVKERTSEIGLLRALGSTQRQIMALFLGEATVLAGIGGLAGLVLGVGGAQLLTTAIPALPVHTPVSYVLIAEALAVVIGMLAGVLPARQAARLNPVEALRAE